MRDTSSHIIDLAGVRKARCVTGGKSRFVALGAAEAKAGLMARASLALTP